MLKESRIAIVIPCYRVRDQICWVLRRIPSQIERIYVIDDCCPQRTGHWVSQNFQDPRLRVIYHEQNEGVGGAVMSGYQAALDDEMDIIVKLDGDGQMDPTLVSRLIEPIQQGLADYTKGNRFYSPESLSGMPWGRLIGNGMLSFLSKAVSGYWNLMDPTNGYTAIHAVALSLLPLAKIDKRYFFENDLLFRLSTIRAVVMDVPMDACYRNEHSELNIGRVCLEFPGKFLARFFKRLSYNYFIRDFNVCSLYLIGGVISFSCGLAFGLYHWGLGYLRNTATPVGTIMLAALAVILGFQLLLSATTFDAISIPRQPLHLKLPDYRRALLAKSAMKTAQNEF